VSDRIQFIARALRNSYGSRLCALADHSYHGNFINGDDVTPPCCTQFGDPQASRVEQSQKCMIARASFCRRKKREYLLLGQDAPG
jgi:hypothetical protein